MKKMLLGLMLSATLLGGTAVTANAADTTGTTGTSDGTVSFTGGDLTMATNSGTLDFGSGNKISNADSVFNVADTATAPIITITDLRGTGAGWNLTVKQSNQFTNTENNTLDGASINLNGELGDSSSKVVTSGVALDPDNGVNPAVATAAKDTGLGTTYINYSGSTLHVPSSSPVRATSAYQTTLTWNLGSTPDNK